MSDIINFPGEYRRPVEITAREIYDAPVPSDLMVWEVCPYTRGSGDGCAQCPPSETDEHGRIIKRGCRSLAEEACRIVMAVQKREAEVGS